MSNDPVSPYRRTLAQRGGGIACCCILLVLCAVVHILGYGVLAFTDLTETTLTGPVDTPPPLIVTADGTPPEAAEATASVAAELTGDEPAADVNTVMSRYGVMIANAVNISRGVAFIATLLLIGQLLLATVVAGQANLIGLPRVASAATGSFLLGIIVAPWGELFPELGYPGAFVTFAHIEGALAPEGIMEQIAAYGTTIALPGAVLLLSAIIALRYRVALDEGLTTSKDEEEDDAFDPSAAIAAVRAAKSEAATSGTDDESLTPLQADEEEEPAEPAVNRPLMTSSSSLDDDTQSMLHRSARKPRSRRKPKGEDDDGPKPPGDEDTRRATQVGSTEPLRRPI